MKMGGLAPLGRYDFRGSILGLLVRRFAPHCAGRELNPGYELGKLMSYH
jgi:hypothetical protein